MAYTLPDPSSGNSAMRPKNRAWGFSRNGRALPLENRRRCPKPRRKSRPTPTIFTPGIPQWPSRDPIGENGGLNLYGFVGNDALDRADLFGLSTIPSDKDIQPAPFTDIAPLSSRCPPFNQDGKCTEVSFRWFGANTPALIAAHIPTSIESSDVRIMVPGSLADAIAGIEKSLKRCQCIKSLTISTHGYNGGVTVGSDKLYTADHAKTLARLLEPAMCKDSKIRLMSCGSKGVFPKELAMNLKHGVQYGEGTNGIVADPSNKGDKRSITWIVGGSGVFHDVSIDGTEFPMDGPLEILRTGLLPTKNKTRIEIEREIKELNKLGLQ